MSPVSAWVVRGKGDGGQEPEAVCGYCGDVITEPGQGAAAIAHMTGVHGRELPVVVYRGEDQEGSDGRWTALACTPGEWDEMHPVTGEGGE